MNHSMYSKGDTIEFKGGQIAIVLDKGISGLELYYQSVGTRIYMFCGTGFFYSNPRYVHVGDKSAMAKSVWYPVLVGDVKGWYSVIPGLV